MITNLEQQIQFYLSYRTSFLFFLFLATNVSYIYKTDQDKTNRLLHMLSVPIIYLSFLLFSTYLNISFLLTFTYLIYVFYLDSVVGLAFLPFALLLYSVSLAIHSNTTTAIGLIVAFLMQVVAWVIQIAGHSVYEGNKPAFLTSLVHAVLAAPLVIYLEALFSLGLLQSTQDRLQGARDLTWGAAGEQPEPAQYGGTT